MIKKSITKNYLYNLVYQILIIVTPLLTTPYVSRILGASGIGQYDSTQAVVQYFILFGTLGLHMYGQQEVAYVQQEKEKRSKVFYEILFLKCLTMAISLLAYLIFINFTNGHKLLYLIQIVDLISALFDISWFFYGIEEFKTIVVRNIIVRIMGVAGVFLFIKTPQDVPYYVLAHSIPVLLGNLSVWNYIKKEISWISVRCLNIKKHMRPALLLFLPQIATQIYVVLDKTMIMLLTSSDTEVGYYGQAQRLIKLILTVITSICTVLNPRISNAFARKEYKDIQYYMNRSFDFAYMLAIPMILGVVVISDQFVPWFFGDNYDKVVPLMQLLSLIILFISFSNIIGFQFLLPTKRRKQYTISVTIGAAVNLILNLLLIPAMASIGAAIASVLAELLVLITQLIYVRRIFSLTELIKRSWRYLVSGTVMLILIATVHYVMPGSRGILIEVPLGIGSYFLMLILFQEENVLTILHKIRRYVHIRKG